VQSETQTEHVLWLLYHIERDLKAKAKEINVKKRQLDDLTAKQDLIEKELKGKKKEQVF
jgi:hypothetical protein